MFHTPITKDQPMTTERNKAFQDYALDHFKHFDAYPMEFEYDGVMYDTTWVWNQLEKTVFKITDS